MSEARNLEPLEGKSDLKPVFGEAQAAELRPYDTLIKVLLFLLFAVACFCLGGLIIYAMFQGHLDGLTPTVKAFMKGLHLKGN